MFLNNCLKVVGAAVTYFYGVFIEDFVVAVFLWEMLADQVQKFSSDERANKHIIFWSKKLLYSSYFCFKNSIS